MKSISEICEQNEEGLNVVVYGKSINQCALRD